MPSAADTHGYIGSDIASLCSKAVKQQIREKMDLIDLDEETINAEVFNALRVTMENFRFTLARPIPPLSEKPSSSSVQLGTMLVVWTRVKQELQETITYPVEHPEKFIMYGMSPSKVFCSTVLPVLVRRCWQRPFQTSVRRTLSASMFAYVTIARFATVY